MVYFVDRKISDQNWNTAASAAPTELPRVCPLHALRKCMKNLLLASWDEVSMGYKCTGSAALVDHLSWNICARNVIKEAGATLKKEHIWTWFVENLVSVANEFLIFKSCRRQYKLLDTLIQDRDQSIRKTNRSIDNNRCQSIDWYPIIDGQSISENFVSIEYHRLVYTT